MKILVTGATGQLGYDVCRALEVRNIEYLGVSTPNFDLTDKVSVATCIHTYRPDAVIHCAAYTKVDLAEDEQARCMAVNGEGTRNIALACRDTLAKLVYPSTDYVFPGKGKRPYETGDAVGPLNVYGVSKLAGEQAVQEILEKHFIVRISWVYGQNGNNFIKTMMKLGQKQKEVSVVGDQVGSPTYTVDLAPLLCDMVQTNHYGVYHATNEGTCSWAELAEETFQVLRKAVMVHSISTAQYAARALRPLNSRLSKRSLDAAGFTRLPDWRDALRRFLKVETD